jgi:hypothetical protein
MLVRNSNVYLGKHSTIERSILCVVVRPQDAGGDSVGNE